MGISSNHFSDAELSCRHCGKNECKQVLLDSLEQLRLLVGRPITVIDAYRCPEHNAEVGGAKKSQHMLGLAADIRVQGFTGAQLEAAARLVPGIRGIGRSDAHNMIHVDCRVTSAHWCYNAAGKEVPYFPPAHPAEEQVA